MLFRITFSFLLLFISSSLMAQNNARRNNHNQIGWYNYFGTIKLNPKWSLHSEYQWRRVETIQNWQQSLLRLGINYQTNPKLQLRVGYGWIETFPYGEIPLNGMGKDFTEHRLFEVATLTDKIGKVDLSHRFMLEQRWVGRYSNATLTKEDEYLFLNRLRYLFRLQAPITKDGKAYAAIYDEIFIGFGKNVNENIFDQNRISILLGYKFSPQFRLEAGFLNQTLQLGREVNNQNVFQYNNGLIINSNFNF